MKDIFKTEFFVLMNESSQEITNQEMHNAYGKFIAHIDTISQENDFTSIIRKLNITRAELVFLSTQIQHEQGEKRPKICLSTKNTIYS
jgi:hypothetical protein